MALISPHKGLSPSLIFTTLHSSLSLLLSKSLSQIHTLLKSSFPVRMSSPGCNELYALAQEAVTEVFIKHTLARCQGQVRVILLRLQYETERRRKLALILHYWMLREDDWLCRGSGSCLQLYFQRWDWTLITIIACQLNSFYYAYLLHLVGFSGSPDPSLHRVWSGAADKEGRLNVVLRCCAFPIHYNSDHSQMTAISQMSDSACARMVACWQSSSEVCQKINSCGISLSRVLERNRRNKQKLIKT